MGDVQEVKVREPAYIIAQTNDLAAKLYKQWGYDSVAGFRFDLSNHGHEIIAWQQACIAQEMLTNTCIDDVISEIDEYPELIPS